MKKMMKMVSLLLLVTLLFIGCEQSGTKPPETQQPGSATGGGQLIQKELVAKLLIQVTQVEVQQNLEVREKLLIQVHQVNQEAKHLFLSS